MIPGSLHSNMCQWTPPGIQTARPPCAISNWSQSSSCEPAVSAKSVAPRGRAASAIQWGIQAPTPAGIPTPRVQRYRRRDGSARRRATGIASTEFPSLNNEWGSSSACSQRILKALPEGIPLRVSSAVSYGSKCLYRVHKYHKHWNEVSTRKVAYSSRWWKPLHQRAGCVDDHLSRERTSRLTLVVRHPGGHQERS